MVGLRIAEPIVETLRVDLCMYAEDRRTLTHKLLDPRLLAFKRPHTQSTRTARIDEYETSIYTFRCTSLDSIAGRSNEHIASSLRLRCALDSFRVDRHQLRFLSFWFDFGVEGSECAAVAACCLRFIMFRNVCALYSTLQSIVFILPRRASCLLGLAT